MTRSLRLFLGLAAWILVLPAFAEGPARLVADLAPGSFETGRGVSSFARVGNRSVFLGSDNESSALWITDGTAQGTRPLAVLCPPCGVAPLGSTGSIAFYGASEGYFTFDTRVWRSDGTPQGTFPVTGNLKLPQGLPDARTFSFHSSINGERLFFTGCNAELGCELWSSDGSPAGSAPVGEIVPGPGSANIRELAAIGDQAFLIVGAADGSSSLWLANGPGHSLTRLRETPQARFLTAGAGRAFFIGQADGLEIWTSDGTAAGTRPLTSYSLPNPFKETWGLKLIDGHIYFVAGDGILGTELWSLGEQPESLRRLTDFTAPAVAVGSIEKAGNRIVFLANVAHQGTKLWSTRGSLRSTSVLAGCPGGCPLVASSLAGVDRDRFVFYSSDRRRAGFWVTDGTGGGTRLLKHSERRDNVQWAAAGGRVLFEIINEYEVGELWITDGTAAGTFFFANGGPGWSHYYGFTGPLKAGTANGRLLFSAGTSTAVSEVLWSSDGSPSGTRPLYQASAARSSYPHGLAPFKDGLLVQSCLGNDWELRFLRAAESTRLLGLPFNPCEIYSRPPIDAGGIAYFFLYRDDGISLWRTDGTPAGTTAIVPAQGADEPEEVTRFGEQAAFWLALHGPNNGLQSQLWRTDGSPAGTQKLFDLPPNVEMYVLTGIGDKLYFFDSERQGENDFAYRPWVSDGTLAGTRPLAGAVAPNVNPQANSLIFGELGGRVFFPLKAGDGPLEIWSTDGTPEGTSRAITAASGVLDPKALTLVGGRLYFAARRVDDTSGRLLPWVSDGTDAGTMPLADVELGADSFAPLDRPPFVELGDRVYFAAADPVHGEELWTTDGTPAGTSLVRDIAPGFLGSYPRSLVGWHGQLYFRARDRMHGMELWTSDGSRKGTRLVQDIAAGTSWSTPGELTAIDEGLYFSANDGVHGRELWVLPAAALASEPQ